MSAMAVPNGSPRTTTPVSLSGQGISESDLRHMKALEALYGRPDNNNETPSESRIDQNLGHVGEQSANGCLINGDSISHTLPESPKMVSHRGLVLFVFTAGLMGLFVTLMHAYTRGVVRTIERRFNLNSQQTGVLASLTSITHLFLVLFVGYFGRNANKPRIVAVTIMFAVVGGYLMAVPHFFPFSDGQQHLSETSHSVYTNATLMHSSSKNQLCDLRHFSRDKKEECMDADGIPMESSESAGVSPAYYFFVLSHLLSGVGTSAVTTLSMVYVDENVLKSKSSFYIGGIVMGLHALSPLFGLMLASLTLLLPENVQGELIDELPDSYTRIGNWWLGYVISSTALLLLCFPMWYIAIRMTPKSTPKNFNAARQRRTLRAMWQKFAKEFPRDLMHLLRNQLFLIHLVHAICAAYIIISIYSNLVRFIEVHYLETAFIASLIAALVNALSDAIGSLVGGYIVSHYKLRLKAVMKFIILSTVSSVIGIIVIMAIACPQIQMAGYEDPITKQLNFSSKCNAACGCNNVYEPVCGSDNLTYYSSCIAGCGTSINQTYSDCTCIGSDHTARRGVCLPSCPYLAPFAVALCVMSLIGSLDHVPVTIVNFRIVDDDERSFAMGITAFITTLAIIPAPILFGMLIDSTCKLWQTACEVTGACILFDTDRFRLETYGVGLGFEMFDLIFGIWLYILISRSKLGSMSPTDSSTIRMVEYPNQQSNNGSDTSFVTTNSQAQAARYDKMTAAAKAYVYRETFV